MRLCHRVEYEIKEFCARHQRHQNARRTDDRRTQDGADLVLEQFLQWRRLEHQAPVEWVIRRGGEMLVMDDLIRTEIERPDGHGPAAEEVEQLAINTDLLVFCWEGPAGQEE